MRNGVPSALSKMRSLPSICYRTCRNGPDYAARILEWLDAYSSSAAAEAVEQREPGIP
jgi:hypothetical protein